MYAFQVTDKRTSDIQPAYISKTKYETLEEAEKHSHAFSVFVEKMIADNNMGSIDDFEIYIVEWVSVQVGDQE